MKQGWGHKGRALLRKVKWEVPQFETSSFELLRNSFSLSDRVIETRLKQEISLK